MTKKMALIASFLGALGACTHALAKTSAEAIAEYRAALQEDNPADLNIARGEALWKTKRGPNQVSLERCDLGLGAGKVKGAAARLPKYFSDTQKVMDLESRLVHCMVTLQGFKPEDFTTKTAYSQEGQKPTVIEDLTAYLYDASRGQRVQVRQKHPMEKAAYARGRDFFFFKAGTHDFSCASCHGQDGQRIRLQDLPNLTHSSPSAQDAFTHWPAYRVSQGAVRTLQWRLYDCLRQQRLPELKYISPASIDLITFLAVNANGGVMAAPSIRR